MSFEAKLREKEDSLEAAVVDLFNHVHEEKRDDQMMPLFHIVDGDWNEHVIAVALGEPPDKDATANFVRVYCKKAGALLVMFATEAWYRTVGPGEKDPLGEGVAGHPDRIEGLMLSLDSALGARLIVYPIIRDVVGVRLGDRNEWPSGQLEGRFTNFIRKTDA